MSTRGRAIVCGALLCCVLSIPERPAGAADMYALPPAEKMVTVEGQTVAIPIRPQFGFAQGNDGEFRLRLLATASLADLQAKAGTILNALATRKSRCELRWSFPDLASPAVAEGRLKIAGRVRAEVWICDFVKTRIARDTAEFILAVHPENTPDRLAFRAALERFDLGRSLLSDLGLEDELRVALEEALNRALAGDSRALAFPPEITKLGAKFTGSGLVEREGVPELFATAEVDVDMATMARLMSLFVVRQ